MQKRLLFLCLSISVYLSIPTGLFAQTIPSKEAFLNEVFSQLTDSAVTTTVAGQPSFRYFLGTDARPCGFIKYNYDEWIKYNLKEVVPINVLDELAGKCYHDHPHASWDQDSLFGAVCVGSAQFDSIMNPIRSLPDGVWTKQQQRIARRRTKAWLKLPWQERTIYEVSKPEFTDDGRYAMIEMIVMAGKLFVGEYTSLFRRTGPDGWKLIGRSTNWVS